MSRLLVIVRPRAIAVTALAVAALAAPALLSGCGSSTPAAGASGTTAVAVSLYPLQYAVEQVGGTRVAVTNLATPGVEPHDLELTPRDVLTLTSATLVVYERGFQPAVDQVIADEPPAHVLDVSPAADLPLASSSAGDGHEHAGQTQASAAVDPHFWLDPTRYAKAAAAIAGALTTADPAHRGEYENNAKAFTQRLHALDAEYTAALERCATTTFVTSHAAFGYLADRYGLTQVAISGLSPESEPQPARLAQVASTVRAHGVGTVYTETLVSPAVAATVAKETGAKTAVLDPIEGLTDASAGRTYPEVMRANLAALKKGQNCS